MLLEQFVCVRRGSMILSLILLLSATDAFGMEREKELPEDDDILYSASSSSAGSRSADERQNDALRALGLRRSWNYCEDYSEDQLNEAYEQADPRIKSIIKRLQYPEIKLTDPGIRAAFFNGDPGTGKTRASIMMAYKLKWSYIKSRATACTAEHRGGTTVHLRKLLSAMTARDRHGNAIPTIGIIDEIQEIFDYAGDSHYDTASTSRELGGFLEDQRNNENFFLVATMNDCQTFQESIKSRMKGRFFTFGTILDPKAKVKAFLDKICTDKIVLDEKCSEDFLLRTVGQLKKSSGRDLRSFAEVTLDFAINDEGLDQIKIKPEHIMAAIHQEAEDDKEIGCGKKVETAFTQQERHFRTSIKVGLLSQARQRSTKTFGGNIGGNGGISGGIGSSSFGIGYNAGINIGGSASTTTASGMTKKKAKKTWHEIFPEAEESLFAESKEGMTAAHKTENLSSYIPNECKDNDIDNSTSDQEQDHTKRTQEEKDRKLLKARRITIAALWILAFLV